MTDLVTLLLKAGDGGYGRVSFRREKYAPKGGPDGGRGGDGGNVVVRGNASLATLKHFAGVREYAAQDGQHGGRKKQFGAKGADLVIEVPVGTIVWGIAENRVAKKRRKKGGLQRLLGREDVPRKQYRLQEEGEGVLPPPELELEYLFPEGWVADPGNLTAAEFKRLRDLADEIMEGEDEAPETTSQTVPHPIQLANISKDGQEVIVCQGGFGGRGNESFKSGANTTPLVAEYGTFGADHIVVLEQKLLADVGLVGFPSAGKSTLLSVLTKARPKVAAYPFTTLEPHLGTMTREGIFAQTQGVVGGHPELIIADIPGLIEGASRGKGLGFEFLRHVENCTMLLYVLALDETVVFDDTLSDSDRAQVLWEQFVVLQQELKQHGALLMQKPYILSVNKIDLYSEGLLEAITEVFVKHKQEVLLYSAATGAGLSQLRERLFAGVATQSAADPAQINE